MFFVRVAVLGIIPSMPPRLLKPSPPTAPSLTIEEVRIVADLRVMHAKVQELFQIIDALKQRHSGKDVHAYSDPRLLADDIAKVDEIYLWFVKLREERDRPGSK